MNRQTIGRIRKLEEQQVPAENRITLIQLVDPNTGAVKAELPIDRPKQRKPRETGHDT